MNLWLMSQSPLLRFERNRFMRGRRGEYESRSTTTTAPPAIRTSDWAVEKLIDAGPGADGLAWAVRR